MRIIIVGVGGTGLSSIALILKELGFDNIVGIDSNESQITNNLEKIGIKIIIGHGKLMPNFEDFVIYSDAAINSPEIIKSKQLEKNNGKKYHKSYSYFEFIGEISKYFITLAIAGTHGKSTSTAIGISTLAQTTNNFGLGILGALVPELDNKNYYLNQNISQEIKSIFEHIINGNYKNFDHNIIKKYLFMIEADEFNKHLLLLDADYATISNVELDHSDCFKNINEYLDIFITFCKNIRFKIFGINNENNINTLFNIFPEKFILLEKQKFNLKYLIGEHNEKNATLIFNLIKNVTNIDENIIRNKIEDFKGIWRRFELIKKLENGGLIYSDYGHHPTELNVVLKAIKLKYPNKKILTIFQPHQARRVIEFWEDFIEVLKLSDINYIYSIYTARENLQQLIKQYNNNKINDIKDINELGNIFAGKCNGKYIENINEIIKIINEIDGNTLVIVFTAGNLDYELRKNIA